jgi:PBP1b-binding outer membrane lipoprotein LpoB
MKILNLRYISLIMLLAAAPVINACVTNKEVVVSDSGSKMDVEWSQTDADVELRMLTEAISTADWMMQYADRNRGKRPVVLVAPIRNTTGQRLDSYALQIDFERYLQNRSTTTVLTGLAKPDSSRMSPATPISELLSMGKSHNAEYMILSELSARAVPGSPHSTNYLLNVELLDLRTQARVWRDVRTIRRNETLSN